MFRALWANRGFLLLCLIAAWAGIEFAGKGFGIPQFFFDRTITNEEGPRLRDVIEGAAPPGPWRLAEDERAAVRARLSAAFPGSMPRHSELIEMQPIFYKLNDPSRCLWDRPNMVVDKTACNSIAQASELFRALLRQSDPKTQHVMWRGAPSMTNPASGEMLAIFFQGKNGKPQILLDLREVAKGYDRVLIQGYDGHLRPLEAQQLASGIYLTDDPGTLIGVPGMPPPGLFIHGFKGEQKTALSKVVFDDDLQKRHAFFAALTGNSSTAALSPPPAAKYAPTEEVVRIAPIDATALSLKFASMFSPADMPAVKIGLHRARIGWGMTYAAKKDGQFYILFETSNCDNKMLRFEVDQQGRATPIAGVRQKNCVFLIPLPGGLSAADRLIVRRADRPNDVYTRLTRFDALLTDF
jgi:hypothetical protein